MSQGKSIPNVPDFGVDDIARLFALWLQKRCRETPGFEREIADITWTSIETVKAWRKGQRPGMEALLRSLAYGGPHAINDVLLKPMGMAGARFIGEDRQPIVEHLFAARRELDAVLAELAHHPDTPSCEEAFDQALLLITTSIQLVQRLTNLRRSRGSGEVVEMPERERRA